MLHILLLILKIIGIIIAVILGILVLLVCVVLFVPVRYELEGALNGTFAKTRMKAKATWLLHLVRVDLCYEDKKLFWQVRVAWKKIQSGKEGKKTIESEVETYDEEMEDDREGLEEEAGEEGLGLEKEPGHSGAVSQETKGLEEKTEYPKEELEEERECPAERLEEKPKVWEESGRDVEHAPQEPERLVDELEREMEKILEAGTYGADGEEREVDCEDGREEREVDCEDGREEREAVRKDSREEREVDCEDGREERELVPEDSREERETDCEGCEEERSGIWQKITGFCQSIYQKIVGLCRKIAGIPGKVGSAVHGIGDKVKGALEKKDKIIGFLSDEVHQTAFIKARDELFFLLRKLKPRRIRADIHYGFEDPSLTGKVLAVLSMCYPFLGDSVDIQPDFGKRILDGKLEVSGRLRASYFLKLLWKLVWSREVRMTYRHVRNFEL